MLYAEMDKPTLADAYKSALAEYGLFKARGLSLDISRGRPHAEQLDLSNGLLTCLSEGDFISEEGADCRNYGGALGLIEMRRLFAEILNVKPGNVIIGGNSSLNLMFDCIATLMALDERWRRGKLKFICPSPGYDRHFFICEYFGIEMLPVPMTPDGPDMDAAERLAASDADVVGMWCVPVFSNPQGYIYSNETNRRLASMPAANPGFRLFWDNAYAVHHFRGERPAPADILGLCDLLPDRPLVFASFSKISFGGASVSCVAASEANRGMLGKRLSVQTVGPDKINQLRHARFFKDLEGVLAHMRRHAAIIRPKFELACAVLDRELKHTGAGEWNAPDGGYFLSFYTMDGCAKRTAALCREAGVTLTDAGSAFPYGRDPRDSHIRLCPTCAPPPELEQAMSVFCAAVKLAALEKLSEVRHD